MKKNMENNEEYVCCKCGSADVEQKAWVHLRTQEIIYIDDEYYCNSCEKEVKHVCKEEEYR